MPRRSRTSRDPHQVAQLDLPIADTRDAKKRRGGTRAGAGRKPGKVRRVAHRKRPPHKGRHPMLITLRARSGLPSFRQQSVLKLVVSVLRWLKSRAYESRFQIPHFSVQTNHLHFIVEAEDDSIRKGMSGFAIAFARRLNELLGRTGAVWDHRYHRRDLTAPAEVKSGLRYVLQNYRKHGWLAYGGIVDEYSSAESFDGWDAPHFVMGETDTEPWATAARTWLLSKGWKLHGLLLPSEAPRIR